MSNDENICGIREKVIGNIAGNLMMLDYVRKRISKLLRGRKRKDEIIQELAVIKYIIIELERSYASMIDKEIELLNGVCVSGVN